MSETPLYCAPVVRVGAVFREATSADSCASDPIPYQQLSTFLSQHYTAMLGTVHISGRSVEVDVLVSIDDPADVSYVLLNADFAPIPRKGDTAKHQEEMPAKAREMLALHLEGLARICGSTEGLFVPTRQSLPQSFIRPRLRRRRIDMFGLPHNERAAAARDCSLEELASEPRAVILGAPGAGKTTLLRFLAMHLASRWFEPPREGASEERLVPVYVQLRHLDFDHDLSAVTAMATWREGSSGAPIPRVAWVLDGLDEVPPGQLANAKRVIEKLVETNKWDAVFLGSRVTFYDGFLRTQSTHFELQPLSWAQTTQWVHQYVRNFDEARVKPLLHHLLNVPELRQIARNPLLLSVLTHQYQFESVIPQQRVQLLERFVATLCVEWDSCRGISRGTPRGVPPHRRSTALGWLAFEMKSRGATCVRSEDVGSWLTRYPPLGPELGSKDVLRDLAENTGLLTAGRAEGTWEFLHSVFCDYLVARHLVSRTEDVAPLLERLAGGDSWHDVWILACAVTDDARPLLERVLVSDALTGETKALLVTGALAQGLELDDEMAIRCRDLLSAVFARHADAIGGAAQLYATGRSMRLVLNRSSLTGVSGDKTAEESWAFVRGLLTLLYRARWWRTGQAVVSDLRARGGVVGDLAARVIEHEGALTGSDIIGGPSKNVTDDLIVQEDPSEPK